MSTPGYAAFHILPDAPFRSPQSGIRVQPWGYLYGELLTLDDPETCLPAINRLEGFHPDGPCLYRRVLIPARIKGAMLPAWLYVVGDRWTGGIKELSGGVWR